MTIKGIGHLNDAIVAKAGERFTIEDLDEMVFSFLGERSNDYDLKMVRGAVAHQEQPYSFVYVFDWQGSEEELDAVFASATLRHEWVVYAGEVYDARNSESDPFWRYARSPRIVGRFDTEGEAMRAYESLDPELEWILEARNRRNGYLVEVGSHSYSPDGFEYSCGLVDSKIYKPAHRRVRSSVA